MQSTYDRVQYYRPSQKGAEAGIPVDLVVLGKVGQAIKADIIKGKRIKLLVGRFFF
jgi:hypothetical protein